jgi:hypothetical protein
MALPIIMKRPYKALPRGAGDGPENAEKLAARVAPIGAGPGGEAGLVVGAPMPLEHFSVKWMPVYVAKMRPKKE